MVLAEKTAEMGVNRFLMFFLVMLTFLKNF